LLDRTFIHIPGVAETTERSLWTQGCENWNDYLTATRKYSIGSASHDIARRTINRSRTALEKGEHQYFAKKLKQKHAWRTYDSFSHYSPYLHFETDGGRTSNAITTIGLYDGREFRAFVKGDNLEGFRDAITHYSMIVTFFGSGFDIPVLRRRFPDLPWDHLHVDLCHVFRQLKVTGGLKKIEEKYGIERPESVRGLNGYDAILLWRRYQMLGDDQALDRLIAYNREDVVNLETLARVAVDQLREKTLHDPEDEEVP